MSRTLMKAGRVTAAYVEDSQGRRIVLASPSAGDTGFALDRVLVVAMHQGEVRELIATLKQLGEELPPAPAAPSETLPVQLVEAGGEITASRGPISSDKPPSAPSIIAPTDDILTLAEVP